MKRIWKGLVSSLVQPLPVEVDAPIHELVVEQSTIFVQEQIKQLPRGLVLGATVFVIFLEFVSLLVCGARFSRARGAARKQVINLLSRVHPAARFFDSLRSLCLFAYFEHSEIKCKMHSSCRKPDERVSKTSISMEYLRA